MQAPLEARVLSFVIGDPCCDLPFAARLARENGWSREHAERVVAEYLRFVWLAVSCGHPVTPSDDVDRAWHLHLCYTRSYWIELCEQTLGRPLHHGPTRGGGNEDAKYRDWYARTLASYRAKFGAPPSDIWPSVDERFRRAASRTVDPRTHWILDKSKTRRVAAIAGSAALAACSGSLRTLDPISITLGLSALAAIVVAGRLLRVTQVAKRDPRRDSPGNANATDGGFGAGMFFGGCGSGSHKHADSEGGGDHGGSGGGSNGSDSGSSGSDGGSSGSDGGSSGCGSSGCGSGGGCGGD